MAAALPVESADLFVPPLDLLAAELERGLQANFAEARVRVVDCPDLSEPPFNLAAAGITGRPVLVDVGGVMNLQYVANRASAHFDLAAIGQAIQRPAAHFLGPGAGWVERVEERVNSELIATADLGSGRVRSHYAVVRKADGCGLQRPYPSLEFGLLGNFLASDGQRGPVLEIRAARRVGPDNLVSCLRKALLASPALGSRPVALGGSFLVERGTVKSHIMPDFHPCDEFVDPRWHVYYECRAPLTAVSVLATQDLGLDLRTEHSHFSSPHGQGGHYHHDTSPAEVAYLAYYVPCERVWRVARHQRPPPEMHVPRKSE